VKFYKINTEDQKGSYLVFKNEDVEYTNPIEHYSNSVINHRVIILHELTKDEYEKQGISKSVAKKVILENVVKEWNEEFKEIMDSIIPENFLLLLDSESKKEQERLLKEQSISSTTFLAFICKAWSEFGFLFSEYKSENYSMGTDKKNLPNLINVENNEVEKVGETNLTNGQLKQVVEHRKVIVAKILDKDENWHCFLLTYKSLSGKENWRDGKPHLHYISNKWGIARKQLVDKIKSGKHPSTSIHIELFNYRNQTDE